MKKLFLLFAVATMTLSIYSCRETTEENAEDAVENTGDAMESAGENVENAAEEAGNEMEEEVEGTDDMNADDDM